MPEYLAPGVYVEEVSFRAKSIEGVSTSTTGFVGPTRFGPTAGEPELLTSFNQFERIYGGLDQLTYENEPFHNFLAHAVRAYFDNGGRRLYVARAFTPLAGGDTGIGSLRSLGIATTRAAADAGVAAATTALAAARAALAEARAASEAALGAAVGRIRAVQGAPADLGAVDLAGDVLAQVDAIIAVMPAGQPRTDAENARNAVQGAIAAATAQRDRAQSRVALALGRLRRALTPLGAVQGAPLDELEAIDLRGDIAAQLDAIIGAMPPGAARTATEAARAAAQGEITAAVGERDQALGDDPSIPARADAAQADVSRAIAAGVNAANGANPPQVVDEPGLATAGNAVVAALATLGDSRAALDAALQALRLALLALADAPTVAEITAVATAADAAIDAAEAVIAAVDTAGLSAAVQTAAEQARRGERAVAAATPPVFRARFPGAAGNMAVTVTARLSPNVLTPGANGAIGLRQVRHRDLVLLSRQDGTHTIHTATRDGAAWTLRDADDNLVALNTLNPLQEQVRQLSFSVEVRQPGLFTQPQTWTELTIHRDRRQDSITHVFAAEIPNRLRMLETPLVVASDAPAPALALALIGPLGFAALPAAGAQGVAIAYLLAGGNDGQRPDAATYAGVEINTIKSGLLSFEDLEDISILAAPGVTFGAGEGLPYANTAEQVTQQLIIHCNTMRYRVAVLDSPNDQSVGGVRTYRATLDTTRAALYYPWVRILDPLTRDELNVPPSGFIAGIYARNDTERGVHKAPANEVVLGAIGLETPINQRQQEVLNPLGINCLRFFENQGNRVWGARTVSSDPEWKYLNIRRYFAYLEASIERSTQWAVFEPNGEALWANVRRAVGDFLFNEWKSGRLAGAKPEEAFFVQCDRSTITQNDLDNGRMICLIGVAPLYPAEFVIFRIGQWTGDRRA